MPGDASNREALKRIIGLGLVSAGIGAGGRSLMGMRDLLARQFRKKPKSTRPAVVEIGVPTIGNDSDKIAEAPAYYIPPDVSLEEKAKTTWLDWLLGRTHEGMWSKPWTGAAAAGATLGGLYGGYKLIDSGMKALNKRDRQRELELAKEDYRKALIEQYEPDAQTVKKSEDLSENLSEDLSKLYQLTKEAGFWNNLAGKGVNFYLPLAMLLAGGAGMATYNWTKARSPEERLARAIEQREKHRWAVRPPEIYAVTKPQPAKVVSEEDRFNLPDEEEEELVRKYSSAKVASLYECL